MGIEEFVKNVNLKILAESIEHVACSGNTLILSRTRLRRNMGSGSTLLTGDPWFQGRKV